MIDPAPLLDRALKRLSDALATRAPDAAPATPQTPPRSAPPSVKTATDARGRFVATPPKPPAASTTKSPSPRSKKAPPSPENRGFEDFPVARAAPGASCWKVAASGRAVVAAVAGVLVLRAFCLSYPFFFLPAA